MRSSQCKDVLSLLSRQFHQTAPVRQSGALNQSQLGESGSGPMRGQYPGHLITQDQWEASTSISDDDHWHGAACGSLSWSRWGEESLSVITTTAGVTSTSVWDASFPGEDWSREMSELRSWGEPLGVKVKLELLYVNPQVNAGSSVMEC